MKKTTVVTDRLYPQKNHVQDKLTGLMEQEMSRLAAFDDFISRNVAASKQKKRKKQNEKLSERVFYHVNDSYLPPHTCTQFWNGARNATYSMKCKRCNMSSPQYKKRGKKKDNQPKKPTKILAEMNHKRYASQLNRFRNNNNNMEQVESGMNKYYEMFGERNNTEYHHRGDRFIHVQDITDVNTSINEGGAEEPHSDPYVSQPLDPQVHQQQKKLQRDRVRKKLEKYLEKMYAHHTENQVTTGVQVTSEDLKLLKKINKRQREKQEEEEDQLEADRDVEYGIQWMPSDIVLSGPTRFTSQST